MRCSLQHVRIFLSSRLSGVGGGMEVFVGRQSVTLGRSCLCSVVSSVGGMVSMLVMWLISFMLFTFASGVLCWVGVIVMWSLAKRLRSVALLRNVLTSLWILFF
jgi:hypothetical protein